MNLNLLIIIVTYNSGEHIKRCVEGCFKIENETTIVISDNCSSDDTINIAKSLGCEVFVNEGNVGYSRAINNAVRMFESSNFSHVLVLNPDAFIVESINFSTIADLIGFNDIATIKMIADTGEERVNTFKFPRLSNLLLNRKRLDAVDTSRHCMVESIEGSFMFLSFEAFERVDGFDQNIFLYGEDYEFCYRLSKYGGRCHFFPNYFFIHDGGFNRSRKIFVLNGLKYFFKKHKGFVSYIIALAIINTKKVIMRSLK